MATLYELDAAYTELLSRLDAAETPEEAHALWDELDALADSIADKAEAYAKIMRNYQAEAEMYKAEKERLAAKQKAAENAVENLKLAMMNAMQHLGAREIQTPIGKWRVQANPWSCTVLAPGEVPEEYHIPQPDKIDSRAILQHFRETGELVPGCEVQQSQGIRFR